MLEMNLNNRKTVEGLMGGTPLCQERELSLLTLGRVTESITSSRVTLKENDFKMHVCEFPKDCVQFDTVLSVIRSSCPPLSLTYRSNKEKYKRTFG